MKSTPTLLVEELSDRLVVTLNRPDARNAIDLAMIGELHEVCDLLERAPQPVIFTGAGDVFAAGADIAQLRERSGADALEGINSRLFDRVARLPQPTIAAVNGPALGGGAEFTYACDLRLATPNARWANPEPGLGILAAAGAAWRLPSLVGVSIAKQILLGGADLGAQRAVEVGLAQEIVDAERLLDRSHEIVDMMLAKSSLALRLTKLVVDDVDGRALKSDLAQAILFETQDKRDRMSRFLEGRT